MSDSRSVEQLAARLDEVLPPGRQDIFAAPNDPPEIKAAVWIARAPRPVLSGDARHQIENQIRAHADVVFGAPVRFRGLRLTRWAAASLLIVAVAAVLVVALAGVLQDSRSPQAEDPVHVLHVPSSPDTSVFIPSDAILPPARLTQLGGGSTSLFVVPGG